MDLERKIELASKIPTEEIITSADLRKLFEGNDHPLAYNGFEPSGRPHLGFGLVVKDKVEDLLKAGCKFRLFLADWHAWINNKMGGDLELIQKVGKHFVKVWESLGLDTKKIEIVWSSELVDDSEFWKKVILVSKNTTVNRMTRALTIMGRKEGDLAEAAQFIYPAMQVADIFHMNIDICQLGMDQRRANILAREIAEKFRWKKPVAVHHHLLMGLQGPKKMVGFEESKELDLEISSKMSKSIPDSAVFVSDSEEEIKKKINRAFCPEKQIENNPLIEWSKYLIFRGEKKDFIIERPQKFGGALEVNSFEELEKEFRAGKLHPLDLKNFVAEQISERLRPAREFFKKHPEDLRIFEGKISR